jgi:hypothetical protein
MSWVFTKDLPQSSQDDQSSLCLEKFDNPPRTLYDEIGQQQQDFVYCKVLCGNQKNVFLLLLGN